jgi:uncharacterized membrane protein YfcA
VTGVELTVVGVALLFGGCMQGSLGFGLGMLAGPVVALVDPTLVPGTLLLLATVLTLAGVIVERAHLDLTGAGWAVAGRIPGTVVGAALVAHLSPQALSMALAGVVLVGAGVAARGWSPSPTTPALLVAGAASGVMGTATSIGGPPMALVWQRSRGAALRGTMSAFFLVGCLMSVLALVAVDAINGPTVARAAALSPFALGGYALSRLLNTRLDRGGLRAAALTVSVVGAIAVLVQQLPLG